MAIADNVAEIIRLDREIVEISSNKVITTADLKDYQWAREQHRYQVLAIRNYKPPTSSIR